MTKFFAYTVILEEIVDEEEAEAVAQAIRMIRGVAGVAPLEAEPHLYFAAELGIASATLHKWLQKRRREKGDVISKHGGRDEK